MTIHWLGWGRGNQSENGSTTIYILTYQKIHQENGHQQYKDSEERHGEVVEVQGFVRAVVVGAVERVHVV